MGKATAGFQHIHAVLCTDENKFSAEVQSCIYCTRETFLGALIVSNPLLDEN